MANAESTPAGVKGFRRASRLISEGNKSEAATKGGSHKCKVAGRRVREQQEIRVGRKPKDIEE